jgi:uncharacterized RDD family membrane protein YckC
MRDEQKLFFEQRYRGMDAEELVEIYSTCILTDTASEVLERVLEERGISNEQREKIATSLMAESYDEQFAHLASLRDRFLAKGIDYIAGSLICAVAFLSMKLALPENTALITSLVTSWVYLLFSDGLHQGQSFGKTLMKIAVRQTQSNKPCSPGRSFIRNVPLFILSFIDFVFIFSASRRRLGEYLAGTEVVKVSALAS